MNEVHLTIQINATIQVAHLDQINAFFAGVERTLNALPSLPQADFISLTPQNGNGHETGKEVTSAHSHQGRHPE